MVCLAADHLLSVCGYIQARLGVALDLRVESDQYETDELGSVPLVDAGATYDAGTGRAAVFLVNRSLSDAITVTVNLAEFGEVSLLETQMISAESRPGQQ